MTLDQLKSAIWSDVMNGLRGITANPNISIEQIEDEIIDERLVVLKEFSMKNMIPKNDLYMGIHCLNLDLRTLDKCPCNDVDKSFLVPHCEIPQILNDFGHDSIAYFGSIDRELQCKVYMTTNYQQHKYLRVGSTRPYVYIEPIPNNNNMYDCWFWNLPRDMTEVSLIAIFKDPRQLLQFDCCRSEDIMNFNFIDNEVRKRLTEKKLRYYRQMAAPVVPNTQAPV